MFLKKRLGADEEQNNKLLPEQRTLAADTLERKRNHKSQSPVSDMDLSLIHI